MEEMPIDCLQTLVNLGYLAVANRYLSHIRVYTRLSDKIQSLENGPCLECAATLREKAQISLNKANRVVELVHDLGGTEAAQVFYSAVVARVCRDQGFEIDFNAED